MSKLLERSEKAKNLSDDAFKMANDSFQKASNILNTLENFKEVISANKKKAEAAEILKSEINGNLEDARILSTKIRSETVNLQQSLVKSQVDLNMALSHLEKANKVPIVCFYL